MAFVGVLVVVTIAACCSVLLYRVDDAYLECVCSLLSRNAIVTTAVSPGTYMFLLGPLGTDTAEIVLLLVGGVSWKSVILAILDVAVTFPVVVEVGVPRACEGPSKPEMRRFSSTVALRRVPPPVNA